MPMMYVYICPQCGTKSEESQQAPVGWYSVMIPGEELEPGVDRVPMPSRTEYFDTWNCVAQYAATQETAES